MTWWDAEYACDAIGKTIGKNIEMLSGDDLITEDDGSKWARDSGQHTRTKLTKDLHSSIGFENIWIKETKNSCSSFTISLGDGYANTSASRDTPFGFTICK